MTKMIEIDKERLKALIEFEQEKPDETFEIISEKEKLWRGKLVEAETGYITSESNLLIFDKMIILAKAEIAKEAKKNAR